MSWMTRGIAVVLALWLAPPVMGQQAAGDAPDTAEPAEIAVPGAGAYFLELTATIPPELGRETIRHTVWIDGKQVEYKPAKRPPGKPWNVGYVPYFTRLSAPADPNAPAKLLFLEQLTLGSDSRLQAQPGPGYEILQTKLRSAIEGIEAKVAFSGDTQQIYFPTERPKATVTLSGLPAGALTGRIVIQRLRLADTWGEAWWRADIRVVESAQAAVISLDDVLARHGGQASINIDLPTDRYGSLGVTVVLEQGERVWARYLGAAAIVPQRRMDQTQPDGLFIASLGDRIRNGKLQSSEPMPLRSMAHAYKKMGIDWVRCGPNWAEFEPQPGRYTWSASDELFQILRDNGLLAMHLAQIAPTWARPDDDPRLQETKYKNEMIKVDWAPLTKYLPDWTRAHVALYSRYKDVIRASNVWNEPWEGMGITGWKSDGAHYRRLVQGIRDAVNQADPTIKVVAADSSHNTDWKLFAAGMQDVIDVISTHYTSPRSAAFAMAREYNKDLWETETWQAWSGDASSVRHVLYYLANGGDKISLWNYRMLFDHERHPVPAAAWTAGVRHMLDGLKFRQIAHPQRPPFVLVFENARGENRHVAAVMSTLAAGVRGFDGEFRAQFVDDQSRMRLQATEGLRVLDLLANPIETPVQADGYIELTVDAEPRFIESREPIEQFVQRLEQAIHEDLRPVEIILSDLTARAGEGAVVRVTLNNSYNQPLPVSVTLHAEGLQFESPVIQATLPPAGHQTLEVPVVSANMSAGNRYPVRVEVQTPQGNAAHEETLHFSLIARATPQIDGDVSEWQQFGAVPVQLLNSEVRDDQIEAWFPWEQVADSGDAFFAEVAFAADDDALYMMARVRDPSRRILPSMLAGKNLNQMQSPPAEHMYLKAGPIPGDTGDMIQLSLGPVDPSHYLAQYELYPPDHPLRRAGSYLSTLYKYMVYPTDDGSAEVLRVRTPSFYYRHPLPIDYGFLRDHCRIEGARAVVKVLDEGYVYEVAIPWSELDQVPHAAGDRILMSMIVQDDQLRNRLEWSRGRSAATTVDLDFEPAWGTKWTAETQWGFVPATP